MKKYAIIVAGGSGSRMHATVPKQFMLLLGKPMLYYTIEAFLAAYEDMNIILVLPENYMEIGREIVQAYFDTRRIKLTVGGDTRFHSVQRGAALVEEESIIFVHDGARCLVTPALIQSCYEAALEHGNAIPVVQVKDSIRQVNESDSMAMNRDDYRVVQTPQTFHSRLLLPAMQQITYKEKFTDEATVVEAFGIRVQLTAGEDTNIKVTTPVDLTVAEQVLLQRLNPSTT